MPQEAHHSSDPPKPADGEPVIHRPLRVIQRILRVLLVISAIVTGVFLLFLGPLVVAPAIVMSVCYVAVLGVNYLERKARRGITEARMEPVFDQPSASASRSASGAAAEPAER
ncbi:MAG: hypothetical protein SYC29_13355, partial [Planctomycetota bacterium]|nr:hypothetical protein [Planctomycetota bacterium]